MDKNIIFITNLHLWSLDKGKGGRAFITTIEYYIKDAWNIWLVSTGGNIPDEIKEKVHSIEYYNARIKGLLQSKYRLIRFLGRCLNIFINNFFYSRTVDKIIKSNREKRFVIYAYEIAGVRIGRKKASKYHMPFVTRFQGTIIADIPNTIRNRIRNCPHFSALETPADIVIMTNDGTQGLKTLKKLGNPSSNIYFWRNGVNVINSDELKNKFKYREHLGWNDEFVFLMVSRLESWKRVERAIYAMKDLVGSNKSAKLVIVGDGDSRLELEKLSYDLGLTKYIEFVGAIAQDSVFKYMIAANGFLSLYDLSNVGNPLMEAMSCGLPIITLNNGDTSDVIQHEVNGILIDSDNLEEVSKYMIKFINEPEYIDNIGRKAREYAVTNFWSWDDRMKKELFVVGNLIINEGINI